MEDSSLEAVDVNIEDSNNQCMLGHHQSSEEMQNDSSLEDVPLVQISEHERSFREPDR